MQDLSLWPQIVVVVILASIGGIGLLVRRDQFWNRLERLKWWTISTLRLSFTTAGFVWRGRNDGWWCPEFPKGPNDRFAAIGIVSYLAGRSYELRLPNDLVVRAPLERLVSFVNCLMELYGLGDYADKSESADSAA